MAESLAYMKYVCKYHVVFTPKYCRKIICHQLRADIREIIKDLCKWKGVTIVEGRLIVILEKVCEPIRCESQPC